MNEKVAIISNENDQFYELQQKLEKKFKIIDTFNIDNIDQISHSVKMEKSEIYIYIGNPDNVFKNIPKQLFDNSHADLIFYETNKYLIDNLQHKAKLKSFIKRLFDIFFASALLLALSPFLLLTGFLIKIESKGPILFLQKRNGLRGKVFKCIKFRSMKVHQSKKVIQAKIDDDRVTYIGKYIRKLSIDELPQLINIIKGDMSIVGPRPHACEHNIEYEKIIPNYKQRHKVKPGLTGEAQVKGLRGETSDIKNMISRVEQDILYIQKWSLLRDLKIIAKTPLAIFNDRAY